jgi:hypothetical protein
MHLIDNPSYPAVVAVVVVVAAEEYTVAEIGFRRYSYLLLLVMPLL